MNEEEKKKIILDSLVELDGKMKLPCAKAFVIQELHGLGLKEIGKICDDNKIKITRCQLGCFE
jgi:hypothetical protein